MALTIKERLYDKAAYFRIPLTCAFELSPVCNLSCKMCYVRKTMAEVNEQGGLQPLSFWLEAAKQAKELGVLFPLITGGEPFIYPHIREFYEALVGMGMEVSFNSNGTCITEETVSWLKKNPPTMINITLYGASNAAYEALCGDPHGFDKLQRGIRLLREAGIRFRFNCSVTPQNKHELEAIMDFARSYELPVRVASYMFPPVRRVGSHENFTERLSPEEAGYYQVLVDYRQLPAKDFAGLALGMQHFKPLTDEVLREAEKGEGKAMQCLAGRSSAWIDWQGNLSGCGMMDTPRFSLKENTLRQAWEKIVAYTNELRYSPVCTNCVNQKICYACAAMVYNETGGFQDRPSYLCAMREAEKHYYAEFLKMLPPEAVEEAKQEIQNNPKKFLPLIECE